MIGYFLVCETNHMVAFMLKPFCPHFVELGLFQVVVIAAIHFYDKTFRQAYKICNIITNRMLPSESDTTSKIFQFLP